MSNSKRCSGRTERPQSTLGLQTRLECNIHKLATTKSLHRHWPCSNKRERLKSAYFSNDRWGMLGTAPHRSLISFSLKLFIHFMNRAKVPFSANFGDTDSACEVRLGLARKRQRAFLLGVAQIWHCKSHRNFWGLGPIELVWATPMRPPRSPRWFQCSYV